MGSRLVLAALLISSFLVCAQANAGGVVFSGFNCPGVLPCDQSDPGFPTPQKILSSSNSCVTQNTGISSSKGFFDEILGLDSNGCLSTNRDAFGTVTSQGAIPQCCVKKMPTGVCVMHCDMIN